MKIKKTLTQRNYNQRNKHIYTDTKNEKKKC